MDYSNNDPGKPPKSYNLNTVCQMNLEQKRSLFDEDQLSDGESSDEESSHKRMKFDHIGGAFNFVEFDRNYFNSYSDHNLHTFGVFKFQKKLKKPLKFSKSYADIIIDFVRVPSVQKVLCLLDLLYTDSKKHMKTRALKDFSRCERSWLISQELKTHLIEISYKKFCDHWQANPPRVRLFSSKQFKRFIQTLLRDTKCKLNVKNTSLRKLISHNVGVTGYTKKPLLAMCINLIYNLFSTFERKFLKSKCVNYLRLMDSRNDDAIEERIKSETHSIRLYHTDTTRKKTFLEIIEEYKLLTKTDKLSYSQFNDIKYAYTNILGPGEFINPADLEKCAIENDCFNHIDGIKTNPTIPVDLNTINNDDFDFDDIDKTPESLLSILYTIPSDIGFSPTNIIDDFDKTENPEGIIGWVEDLQSRDSFTLMETTLNNFNNVSIEEKEEEMHIQCTSNENQSFKPNNHSNLTNLTKLEKSILTIIIFSNISLYQINWNKFSPSTKTRIFQIIVYFGSLKMSLCDYLKLDFLGLKKKKKCGIEDVEILLKSMQADPWVFQKYFPFSEVEHLMTWPLSKMTADNTISQRNPTINILFSFVKNIISKFCEKVKDFSLESDVRIVLNKESLLESLSCVQIKKYILNTELSLKYANAHTHPSQVNTDTFLNDVLKKINVDSFCSSNTRFCLKKNSLNEKICKSMIDIFKNIVLCTNQSSSESTGINVEAAINNALIILYHLPCFAKAYGSYHNFKYPKCLTNSKYDNTSGRKNHSDYDGVSIKGIEKMQIEPNVNVQTDPIDANNVSMSLITNNIPTTVFDCLNSDQINSSITSDPQCSNYIFNNDFIHDFTNLISEQSELTSDNLFEHIGAIDANNMFNTCDNDMIQINDAHCNPLLFNETCPFDDVSLNNCYDDIMLHDPNFVNDMLGVNLQFQEARNTEEVSLISSCDQLVNYAVSDEISLDELNMAAVDEQYGFDNAGVLLPPFN